MCFSEYAVCKHRMTRPTQAELDNTAEYKALAASAPAEVTGCLSLARALICAFNPWTQLDADPAYFQPFLYLSLALTAVLVALQVAAAVVLGVDYNDHADLAGSTGGRVAFYFFVLAAAYGLCWVVYDVRSWPVHAGCVSACSTGRTCHLQHVDHALTASWVLGAVNLGWLIASLVVSQHVADDDGMADYLRDHHRLVLVVWPLSIAWYLCGVLTNLVVGVAIMVYGERRYFDYIKGNANAPIRGTAGGGNSNNKGKGAKQSQQQDDNPENSDHIVVRHG